MRRPMPTTNRLTGRFSRSAFGRTSTGERALVFELLHSTVL
jgi:hypothetical protein